MSTSHEDSLLDFDLDFLQPENTPNKIPGLLLRQKYIAPLKRRIIKASELHKNRNAVIEELNNKNKELDDTKRKLEATTKEYTQTSIEYQESLQTCMKLEKENENLNSLLKNSEAACIKAVTELQAMISHAKQLEQLVKQQERKIESDKLDKISREVGARANAKTKEKDMEILKWKKKYEILHKHCQRLQGKKSSDRKLNKERLREHDKLENETDEHSDVEEQPFRGFKSPFQSQAPSLCSVDLSRRCPITGKVNARMDIDNEVVSVDTGRGSSLSSSDNEKWIYSPEYVFSPIQAEGMEHKRKFTNTASSPIPQVKMVETATSTVKVKTVDVGTNTKLAKVVDGATSPITIPIETDYCDTQIKPSPVKPPDKEHRSSSLPITNSIHTPKIKGIPCEDAIPCVVIKKIQEMECLDYKTSKFRTYQKKTRSSAQKVTKNLPQIQETSACERMQEKECINKKIVKPSIFDPEPTTTIEPSPEIPCIEAKEVQDIKCAANNEPCIFDDEISFSNANDTENMSIETEQIENKLFDEPINTKINAVIIEDFELAPCKLDELPDTDNLFIKMEESTTVDTTPNVDESRKEIPHIAPCKLDKLPDTDNSFSKMEESTTIDTASNADESRKEISHKPPCKLDELPDTDNSFSKMEESSTIDTASNADESSNEISHKSPCKLEELPDIVNSFSKMKECTTVDTALNVDESSKEIPHIEIVQQKDLSDDKMDIDCAAENENETELVGIKNNSQMETQEIQEKKCLELNNSNNMNGDRNNDNEIETIFDAMRLNFKLITPIPLTPRKSYPLEAQGLSTQNSESTCHVTCPFQLETAKTKEDNRKLQTALDNLMKDVFNIKCFLKTNFSMPDTVLNQNDSQLNYTLSNIDKNNSDQEKSIEGHVTARLDERLDDAPLCNMHSNVSQTISSRPRDIKITVLSDEVIRPAKKVSSNKKSVCVKQVQKLEHNAKPASNEPKITNPRHSIASPELVVDSKEPRIPSPRRSTKSPGIMVTSQPPKLATTSSESDSLRTSSNKSSVNSTAFESNEPKNALSDTTVTPPRSSLRSPEVAVKLTRLPITYFRHSIKSPVMTVTSLSPKLATASLESAASLKMTSNKSSVNSTASASNEPKHALSDTKVTSPRLPLRSPELAVKLTRLPITYSRDSIKSPDINPLSPTPATTTLTHNPPALKSPITSPEHVVVYVEIDDSSSGPFYTLSETAVTSPTLSICSPKLAITSVGSQDSSQINPRTRHSQISSRFAVMSPTRSGRKKHDLCGDSLDMPNKDSQDLEGAPINPRSNKLIKKSPKLAITSPKLAITPVETQNMSQLSPRPTTRSRTKRDLFGDSLDMPNKDSQDVESAPLRPPSNQPIKETTKLSITSVETQNMLQLSSRLATTRSQTKRDLFGDSLDIPNKDSQVVEGATLSTRSNPSINETRKLSITEVIESFGEPKLAITSVGTQNMSQLSPRLATASSRIKHDLFGDTLDMPNKDLQDVEGAPHSSRSNRPIKETRKLSITSPKLAITSPKLAISSPNLAITSIKPVITSPNLAITSPKLVITSPKLAITSPKLTITSQKLTITSPKLQITSPKLAITSPKLAITSVETQSMSQLSPKPTTRTRIKHDLFGDSLAMLNKDSQDVEGGLLSPRSNRPIKETRNYAITSSKLAISSVETQNMSQLSPRLATARSRIKHDLFGDSLDMPNKDSQDVEVAPLSPRSNHRSNKQSSKLVITSPKLAITTVESQNLSQLSPRLASTRKRIKYDDEYFDMLNKDPQDLEGQLSTRSNHRPIKEKKAKMEPTVDSRKRTRSNCSDSQPKRALRSKQWMQTEDSDTDIKEQQNSLENELMKTSTWHPKESILCAMIEKYAVKSGKKPNRKVSDAVLKNVTETIENYIVKVKEGPNKPNVMNELAQELQKYEFKNFVSGLVCYLTNSQRKLELITKSSSCSAPQMTKSEEILLYVIRQLKNRWCDHIVETILSAIEHALFKLNQTPDFDIVESTSHFYALLCRYFNLKSRLIAFMLDAMYCILFKSVPLIRQCLDVWPHVIPLAHMSVAKTPLVTCFVYLLHFYKCEDRYGRVQEIRNLLCRRYFYQITEWNERTILELFYNAIRELKDISNEKKMLRIALIILGKRHGPKWTQNNIIKKMLNPFIEKEDVPDNVKEFCISMIGPLIKPYPTDMKVHCEVAINQLADIFNTTKSKRIEEAVIISLVIMHRHNSNHVIEILLSRKMQDLSPDVEKLLCGFVRSKPLNAWLKCLSSLAYRRQVEL